MFIQYSSQGNTRGHLEGNTQKSHCYNCEHQQQKYKRIFIRKGLVIFQQRYSVFAFVPEAAVQNQPCQR